MGSEMCIRDSIQTLVQIRDTIQSVLQFVQTAANSVQNAG